MVNFGYITQKLLLLPFFPRFHLTIILTIFIITLQQSSVEHLAMVQLGNAVII